MNCPHCYSSRTTQLQRTTDLGYAVFRLLAEIKRLQHDAKRHGLDINVTWCKM